MWEWLKFILEILRILFFVVGGTMSLLSVLVCFVLCIRTSQISHEEERIEFQERWENKDE